MEVYLPIAEVSINIFTILFLSFIVGFLSGIFGVGGGFLMTPFLIFLGIPPTYAVANEANNILASSTSGSLTHWFKNTLDYKMGFMIVLGGIVGTIIGIFTFTYFKEIGKIDLIISLAYMYVLATIGTLMLIEGVAEIDRTRKKIFLKKKLHSHYWIHGLPFRIRFKKSKLYESALAPIILGLIVGFIASIMGVGGAFLLVPALIYIIGMPTKLVPGTSLFVTIFVTAFVTILHAFNYQSIDIVLVVILIVGSIIGIQLGIKVSEYLKSSELKTLMAILFLAVGIAVAYDTFFKNHKDVLVNNNSSPIEMNQFYETLIELSNSFPASYGLFCIFLAVGLGILASFSRKSLSKYKKKLSSKKAAW
ncbi:MAG: sulfite exporter TauE/SafE family protein [Pelagibacteraceae bacterium]|nr:sulfite exporter TauE/SafE family protein [Pelagibacteraceae bacterium]